MGGGVQPRPITAFSGNIDVRHFVKKKNYSESGKFRMLVICRLPLPTAFTLFFSALIDV
jgi:hypothetical protein